MLCPLCIFFAVSYTKFEKKMIFFQIREFCRISRVVNYKKREIYVVLNVIFTDEP